MSTSLGHMPVDKWAFDSEVTQCFSDMLARSIPQLETMRQLVTQLGLHFVHAGDHILDLGCSLGDALMPFVRHYGAQCRYTGLELSAPMVEAAQKRFASWHTSDAYGTSTPVHVTIRQADIRREYPTDMHALTLAILTLMFVSIEHRQQVVRRMYRQTQPAGAVLVVEKILGASADLDSLYVEEYYAGKRRRAIHRRNRA